MLHKNVVHHKSTIKYDYPHLVSSHQGRVSQIGSLPVVHSLALPTSCYSL